MFIDYENALKDDTTATIENHYHKVFVFFTLNCTAHSFM